MLSRARERWRLSPTLCLDLRCDQFSLNPLHRANARPAQARRLEDAGSACQFGSDRLDLGLGEWRLTDGLTALGAVLTSPLHSGLDPLLNDGSFELCKNPKHLEEGAPGWGGRIYRLAFEIEIAPDRPQFCEKADEVLQAAPKPINRPRCDNVDPAGGCRPQQPVEAGALFSTFGAADPLILELADNSPAPRLARRDESRAL